MSEFNGFPKGMRFTPIPNIVFSNLFPLINDITELKVLLHIFEILYPKKGNFRFTTSAELLQQSSVFNSLKTSPQEALGSSLESLTQKAIILHLPMVQAGKPEDVYFINTEDNRILCEKIRNQEIAFPGLEIGVTTSPKTIELPNIFTLYEQNIGMLTPLIADELKEAKKQYPEAWIKDAIKESVTSNKRNWRFIARILERWSAEGKDYGTNRGDSKKDTDPNKFIRGKYGHMVQR